MSAGHTPAPWGIGITYRDSGTGFWQCLITRNGVAFITVGGVTKEECEANARLIAATPEMLEAAKNALPFLRGLRDGLKEADPDYDGTLYEIRAIQRLEDAIAKAGPA